MEGTFIEYYRAENGRILEGARLTSRFGVARLTSRYSSYSDPVDNPRSGGDTQFFGFFNFFDQDVDRGPRARVRPRANVPNMGPPRTAPPTVDFFGLFR
jgi:hypothetical protein